MIRKTFSVVGVAGEEQAGEFKTNTYQGLDYYAGCFCLTISFHHYHRLTNVVLTDIVKA